MEYSITDALFEQLRVCLIPIFPVPSCVLCIVGNEKNPNVLYLGSLAANTLAS